MRDSAPKHLYLLDILRGLASLAVVVWHYQHFFYVAPGKISEEFTRSSQPFYFILSPLYNNGSDAVQLFFVLSGFVFYFIYSDNIKNQSVSAYDFVVFRFSRLYPLYFVTLIFVAIIQLNAHSTLGSFIVYPMNDLRHFLLSLFFASNWGLEFGYSFNAPTWSVSVEILLYAVFFAVALVGGKRVVVPIAMMFAGIWVAAQGRGDIGWGLYCFFSGGIAFLVYERWCSQTTRWQPILIAAGLFLISAIAVYGFCYTRFSSVILAKVILFGGCFPAFVLLLATIQNLNHEAGRSIKIIGDITYATYLLHFPVQLSVIWLTKYYGISLDYTDPIWFVLFIGIVILVSVPTYYFFEIPVQYFLRRHLKSKPVKPASGSISLYGESRNPPQ